MANTVEELLDMLYTMIDEAKSMPLSNERCVIERGRALDLLDDIRTQFPVEFSEARKLQESRKDYLAAAKREADSMKKQAEQKARQLLSENELMGQAKQRAAEMLRVAEERSRELRRSANEYCEDALRRTEEAVSEAHEEVKRSRARFRSAATGAPSAAPTGRVVYNAEDN